MGNGGPTQSQWCLWCGDRTDQTAAYSEVTFWVKGELHLLPGDLNAFLEHFNREKRSWNIPGEIGELRGWRTNSTSFQTGKRHTLCLKEEKNEAPLCSDFPTTQLCYTSKFREVWGKGDPNFCIQWSCFSWMKSTKSRYRKWNKYLLKKLTNHIWNEGDTTTLTKEKYKKAGGCWALYIGLKVNAYANHVYETL